MLQEIVAGSFSPCFSRSAYPGCCLYGERRPVPRGASEEEKHAHVWKDQDHDDGEHSCDQEEEDVEFS